VIHIETERHGLICVAWCQVSVMTVATSVGLTRRSAEKRLMKRLDKHYGKRNDW
jgi:hypothetical protein